MDRACSEGVPRSRVDVLRRRRPPRSRDSTWSTRNAINSGQIPGPRYLAASQEITVPGGLGDETLPHLPFPEFSFAVNVSGPEDMRRVCRMFLQYGVDSIKLNLSGDNFTPDSPADTTWMTDAKSRRGDARGARPRQARHRARAFLRRLGQAGAAPRHRRHLSTPAFA